MDAAALKKMPKLDDQPVTVVTPPEGATLSEVLDLLTKPLGLTWAVRDGQVVITVKEESGKK